MEQAEIIDTFEMYQSCQGFGCTGEVCTDSQCEKGQCTVTKMLAKYGWWKCQESNTRISQRSHRLIIDNSLSNQEIHKETSTIRGVYGGLVILAHPWPMIHEGTLLQPLKD